MDYDKASPSALASPGSTPVMCFAYCQPLCCRQIGSSVLKLFSMHTHSTTSIDHPVAVPDEGRWHSLLLMPAVNLLQCGCLEAW